MENLGWKRFGCIFQPIPSGAEIGNHSMNAHKSIHWSIGNREEDQKDLLDIISTFNIQA